MGTRRDPVLAPARLEPVYVDGELAGLAVDQELIPFPGLGLETELGVATRGGEHLLGPALDELLARRPGIMASTERSATEADRIFTPLGSSYREGDHLELNTWLHRSAAGARLNLEAAMQEAGRLAGECTQDILLHALGGDGQGHSWSSLHCNVPVSNRAYRALIAQHTAGRLIYDFYLPAELSLAVIDGNGGIGEQGFLLSDRTGAFDSVFGVGTMRPSRAMVVDRAEPFGTERSMGMLRALSFGRASIAGLAMHQLHLLMLQLAVHGVLVLPLLDVGDALRAGHELARHEQRRATARLQARVQRMRRCVWDGLGAELGSQVRAQLLPDLGRWLDHVDVVLAAIERDDETLLLEHCDWARKRHVLERARRGSWIAERERLIELNVHYARLDGRALRHLFPQSSLEHAQDDVPLVPHDTSSFLLAGVVARALQDPAWRVALRRATLSWKGIRVETPAWLAGAERPACARAIVEVIELLPWAFTERTVGARLDEARALSDLMAALGSCYEIFGDYAGPRGERGGPERRDIRVLEGGYTHGSDIG